MSRRPSREPCGEPSWAASARRHYRRGEQLCPECAAWQRVDVRTGQRRPLAIDTRQVRNGMPEFRPYTYRGTGEDAMPWAILDDPGEVILNQGE